MQKFFLLTISFLSACSLSAQSIELELKSSAGDTFKNASYSISWSIGEVVTGSHDAGSMILTQGFHQGTYVTVQTENIEAGMNIQVFPNPTSDYISLFFESTQDHNDKVFLELTDTNGKLISKQYITANETDMNLSTYTSGIYFLTVRSQTRLYKTFKIIKK